MHGKRGVLGLAVLTVVSVGTAWGVVGLFDEPTLRTRDRAATGDPDDPSPTVAPPAPAGTGRSTRIVLSESDVRALVSEHVSRALQIPVSGVRAGLPGEGVIEVAIRVQALAVVDRAAPALVKALPSGWLERRLWLKLALRPNVDTEGRGRRRRVQFNVEEFGIGSRRLPVTALRALFGASVDSLGWPLPRGIDDVIVERGRLILSGGS
jgi:hypothetical protein